MRKPADKSRRKLRVERLEDRRLMAGLPELLKDINVGATGSTLLPTQFVEVGATTFFVANNGASGHELWKTNGTAAGTVLVKDIAPGAANSYPINLTNVNGTLFFSADNGLSGHELWKSNGTAAGTILVKDIIPGTEYSAPRNLTNVNGTLFFRANDGTTGQELWKSDGTASGTTLVKDIFTGNSSSFPQYLTNFNGTLIFKANSGAEGEELWRSNGTSEGTTLIKDIWSGSGGSNPSHMTILNDMLIFSARDGVHQTEIWKTDGTSNGTVMVRDIKVGSEGSNPHGYENANGTLFFVADDGAHGFELWKTDGTESGTALVKDIRNGNITSSPVGLTNVNGKLFFQANNGVDGAELWKSDGSPAGTMFVKDIRLGSGDSSPGFLRNVGGTLVFNANDGTSGIELWKSDGTSAGTTLVKDIRIGGSGSVPRELTNVNGNLFFSADNGTLGREVWILKHSLAIAATSANKVEGNSGSNAFTFTVTRNGLLSGSSTVQYGVTGVGANPATASDFFGNVFPSGTVSFAPGQTTSVITIPVKGDTTVEANEGFRVTLSNPSSGAAIATAAANGSIRNDDATLAITGTSVVKNEGNAGTTNFTFTVNRSGDIRGNASVNYVVAGAGLNLASVSDFVGNQFPSGQVNFAAGQTTLVISIPIKGDTTVEPNEGFVVTLTNPSAGASIATASASGIIRNDDTALAIAANSANKFEGNSGFSSFMFTVTRSGILTGTTTVNYAVTGDGPRPAQTNDFVRNVFPSGVLTFAAGETSKVISILVRGDTAAETNEGFRVTLSGASLGTTITTAIATGLIRNDDT